MKKINEENIKIIAFDLDNTLYDETIYFDFGIDIVVDKLEKELGFDPKKMKNELLDILKKNGKHYHYLFDDFLKIYSLEKEEYLPKILNFFSQVEKDLKTFEGVTELLQKLSQKYELVIITNGRKEIQERKIKLLNIKNFFSLIIFASEFEDKPSKKPFEHLLQVKKIDSHEIIYIADNPETDFIGAKKLGITTIRIHNKEFENKVLNKKYDADFYIKNVRELEEILNLDWK